MNIFKVILAFLPLLWLLFSLGKIKMPAYKASMIALLATYIIAYSSFGMKGSLLFQASVEGVAQAAFPILWVIISALFVYNITVETKSMDQIKRMLSNVSPDRRVQGLILAFAFGGFLEAVAGFGTAVAIPAGILSAMGFNPLLAATVCLIANTIPVAFGVIGIPIITLAQITGLSLQHISVYAALQLIPFIVLLPVVLIFTITGSVGNIKGVLGVSCASGIVFALGQTAVTLYMGPELAAVIGSLLSLAVIIIWVRLWPVKVLWLFKGEKKPGEFKSERPIGAAEALRAWSPYILILIIIFMTRFIPSLAFLNDYPFTFKKQFYFGQGGKPLEFQLIAGAGTVLFLSAVLGGLIQKASVKKLAEIFLFTLKQLSRTVVTVVSIVVLSKVMGYSSMVNTIAITLAAATGKFYPVISPFIGALGTFLTGSDTSANVLFGNLQKQTAAHLGISQEWITAANASGATAGKMISPQSISIATAATGLSGNEGRIFSSTLRYCIVYVTVMGILIAAFSFR